MRPAPIFKRDLFRDLFLGMAMSVFVFVCALAWGGPFLATPTPNPAAQAASRVQQTIFRGTVLRDGAQFLLRQASGQIYRLDDENHAQLFEGRTVTVNGTLDSGSELIHVERIVPAAA
jgi:hypothetical protein